MQASVDKRAGKYLQLVPTYYFIFLALVNVQWTGFIILLFLDVWTDMHVCRIKQPYSVTVFVCVI